MFYPKGKLFMNEAKTELITLWLKKAQKDLISAKREMKFETPITETVCFHSQQAAEKFLKAYFVFLDIKILKSHNIATLISSIEQFDNEINELKESCDILTDYSVDIRYPDDIYEPSIEDANEAITLAETLKNYVLKRIDIPSITKNLFDNLDLNIK